MVSTNSSQQSSATFIGQDGTYFPETSLNVKMYAKKQVKATELIQQFLIFSIGGERVIKPHTFRFPGKKRRCHCFAGHQRKRHH